MAGDWHRPEQTSETLRDGWLHSGDLGFIDATGLLHMRGRLSERVTVAGRHWFPRDVEEALLRHPAVRQAALVGLADPDLGQRPVAFVTVEGSADPNELAAFVVGAVGEVPESLSVRVVGDLPMTPTGKISKAQLLARVGGAARP